MGQSLGLRQEPTHTHTHDRISEGPARLCVGAAAGAGPVPQPVFPMILPQLCTVPSQTGYSGPRCLLTFLVLKMKIKMTES